MDFHISDSGRVAAGSEVVLVREGEELGKAVGDGFILTV
jgi:hypothetical protein